MYHPNHSTRPTQLIYNKTDLNNYLYLDNDSQCLFTEEIIISSSMEVVPAVVNQILH